MKNNKRPTVLSSSQLEAEIIRQTVEELSRLHRDGKAFLHDPVMRLRFLGINKAVNESAQFTVSAAGHISKISRFFVIGIPIMISDEDLNQFIRRLLVYVDELLLIDKKSRESLKQRRLPHRTWVHHRRNHPGFQGVSVSRRYGFEATRITQHRT